MATGVRMASSRVHAAAARGPRLSAPAVRRSGPEEAGGTGGIGRSTSPAGKRGPWAYTSRLRVGPPSVIPGGTMKLLAPTPAPTLDLVDLYGKPIAIGGGSPHVAVVSGTRRVRPATSGSTNSPNTTRPCRRWGWTSSRCSVRRRPRCCALSRAIRDRSGWPPIPTAASHALRHRALAVAQDQAGGDARSDTAAWPAHRRPGGLQLQQPDARRSSSTNTAASSRAITAATPATASRWNASNWSWHLACSSVARGYGKWRPPSSAATPRWSFGLQR